MANKIAITVSLICLLAASAEQAHSKDFFLTIGGGSSRTSNQASLEKNVLFFRQLLDEKNVNPARHDVFFSDGDAAGNDLQVKDATTVPKASRLMAEFFGSEEDLGIYYRNHEVPGVRGATTPENIRHWFGHTGQSMRAGDRLIVYVTAHGEGSDSDDTPHDTSILLWKNQQITVSEFVRLLDQLPSGVSVVAIMVQCHAGGFARFIYENADPENGLSKQPRAGFFATLHDRIAAGCTAEIDESTYVEYSTYFWEALAGRTRGDETIAPPDYDGNGLVCFEEAHAYTLLHANTIDMPITTSGEFLRLESLFGNEQHSHLLETNASFQLVLEIATSVERAVLLGLSDQLQLRGDDRIETARERSRERRRRGRGGWRGRRPPPEARSRRAIARDLEQRWPALANVLNPISVELLTTRQEEFIRAIEQHPRYAEYVKQVADSEKRRDPQKQRVKYERFVRTAENTILRENLKRLGDEKRLRQYEALVAAERGLLVN